LDSSAQQHRHALESTPAALLREIRRGLEKEGLRVQRGTGLLSQAAHPQALGSALTHHAITTDYSESLLEFITPAVSGIDEALTALETLHVFTAQHLTDECIWGASMPCIIAGERSIPIAQYGTSNVGQMKRVYRNGLGVRYGRMMQAIAGIHYNFSLPEAMWEHLAKMHGDDRPLQEFQTDGYLALIRNFKRHVWLLVYLLGASPAVCASFLANNNSHHLQPLGEHSGSLYLPFATSLRMGDLGYNSAAQSELAICYNNLSNYVATLRTAIRTPHSAYSAFDITDEGEQAQLNNCLLQIENEFYSPIRPKRVTRSGEAPIAALAKEGIEYIEVRCVDINPFLPLGIDDTAIRILDCFLLSCLVVDSPDCTPESNQRDAENLRRVVDRGRDPSLTLLDENDCEAPFADCATALMTQLSFCADLLDRAHSSAAYSEAITLCQGRIADPSTTPSGQVLTQLCDNDLAFWQLAMNQSERWHQHFLDTKLDPAVRRELEQESKQSLERQKAVETADRIGFSEYLAQFYAQYDLLEDTL